MPMSPGARFGLAAVSGADFIKDIDATDQAQVALLEANAAMYKQGTLAARPVSSGGSPGIAGRLYLATDQTPQQLYYDTGAGWLHLAPPSVSCVIPGADTSSSGTYGLMGTPDQVTGVVMPTNGLIAVWYQATWQQSVAGQARAAIFIGANQLSIATGSAIANQAAASGIGSSANSPLASCPVGLAGAQQPGGGYPGDVTTGQVVGAFSAQGYDMDVGIGGTYSTINSAAPSQFGGPCYIFAAAGTYTVSVQFKTASGSVTASNRKLWVQALA